MAEGTPTDYVLNMRQQGLSNNQIIQSLQRANYTPQQIADAMAQADIKHNVESFPSQTAQESQDYPNYPAPSGAGDASSSWPQQSQQMDETAPPSGGYPEEGGAASAMESAGFSTEDLQQLIEQIIEEKWEDLVKNVSRIADWKEKMDAKIAALEQQINDLKSSFDKLHTSILEKVGEYDKTISSVGTDIKALETVFKKILPGFVENVSELSRITEEMKKKK